MWQRIMKCLSVLFIILIVDCFVIETSFIKINTCHLKGKWQGNGMPVKIIQFSDVHLGKSYGVGTLRKIVNQINKLKPDIIVCTGDFIDYASDVNHREEIIKELKKLNAPYGKYAVYGNHEYKDDGDSIYRHMMRESGFELLVNEKKEIKIEEKELVIIGLDDSVSGKVNIPVATNHLSDKQYNILLAHEPDVVEEIIDLPIDLQLSGHSHGGQFRLPILGALYTPELSKKYIKGMYNFPNSDVKLYVNVGIGTTIIRGRLFNRPEISQFIIGEN